MMHKQPLKTISPLLCSYDSGYQGVYQPGYDGNIVFYDDIAEDLCWDERNGFTMPLPASSGFCQHQPMTSKNTSNHHH